MIKRLLCMALMLTVMAGSVMAQKPAYRLQDEVEYKPQVVRVKFKENQTAALDVALKNERAMEARGGALTVGLAEFDEANKELGALEMTRVFRPAGKFEARHREWGLHLWYEVKVSDERSLEFLLNRYGQVGEIAKVEPVEVYHLVDGYDPMLERTNTVESFAPETIAGGTPNDPSYSSQWGFPAISAAAAWELETGHSSVVVAIEDGGVDYDHADLAGNMWVNTGEIPLNGVDDDNNGYVDDYHGYNFGDNGGDIPGDSHGTHVGGTVAAETNNGIGVAGTAGGSGNDDGVRLMSLSVFGARSQGGFDEAFIYAADMGAAISQNSWGGGAQSSALENAIDYFRANGGGSVMDGGLVVFAAGNDNSSSASIGYPGSYASCLAVASTTSTGAKSSFSNYGSWVDISAPGSAIYSTYPNDGYNSISGTSMACPHVSGVAALVLSNKFRNGEIITDEDLWGLVTGNTTDVYAANPSYTGQLGSGLLNAYSALTGAVPPPPPPPPCYSGTGDVTLTLVTDNYASETSWTLKDSLGNTIASGSGYSNNTTYTETFTGLVGRHTFTINDSYGDGICCSYGNGSYELVDGAGTVLKSGGAFASSESTDICMSQGPNTAPVADAGGPYSGEAGQGIAFDASASSDADGNNLSYSWDFGDGNSGSGVAPTHAYAAAGTYTATVTVSDGMDSDVASATVTVTEATLDPMVTSISMSTASKGPWNTATATITVTSLGSPVSGASVSVSWSGAASGTATGTTNASGVVSFESDRSRNTGFTVTITDVSKSGYFWDQSGTGSATASVMSVQSTEAPTFSVYPNPAQEVLTVMIPNAEQATATLYQMNGQVAVNSFTVKSGAEISLRGLESGMYILMIQTEDSRYTERVVKQ